MKNEIRYFFHREPFTSVDFTVEEIRGKKKPVDYSKIIGENRVVLLGDNHGGKSIGDHLTRYASQFKSAGITHYGIEASVVIKPQLDRLNKGEKVDLSRIILGPHSEAWGKGNYEKVVRILSSLGIMIVPINPNEIKPFSEEREDFLFQSVKDVFDNPITKIAVLIGQNHTHKEASTEEVKPLGQRIMEAGIPLVSVRFVGGYEKNPQCLLDIVRKAGLKKKEFMVEAATFQDDHSVGVEGNPDYVVHLPQKVIEVPFFSNLEIPLPNYNQ